MLFCRSQYYNEHELDSNNIIVQQTSSVEYDPNKTAKQDNDEETGTVWYASAAIDPERDRGMNKTYQLHDPILTFLYFYYVGSMILLQVTNYK